MKLSQGPSSSSAANLASTAPITSIDINIIARIDEPFDDGYHMVQDEFERLLKCKNDSIGCKISLSFHREDDGACTFEHLLESIIIDGEKSIEDAKDNNLVMFLTDDCLLLEPIERVLSCASSVLMSSNRPVLGFLSRLHPGISFCQTRNMPCPPPREEMEFVVHACEAETSDFGLGAFVFDRKIGVFDWSYPFDLSGGTYRLGDVRSILEWIQKEGNGPSDYSHPNRLEIGGNMALAKVEAADTPNSKLASIAKKYKLNAVPSHPFLLILAINRVQDVCTAPIAEAISGNEGPSYSNDNDVREVEPAALLKYLHEGKKVDIGAYRAMYFNSSHVGDVLLSEGKGPPCTQSGGVSVLIPVHKGPKEYAAHSMRSVMMQPIDEFNGNGQSPNCGKLLLSPMQLVIVDDRCTDGSIKAMVDVATSIAESSIGVSLTVRDMRSGTVESVAIMHASSHADSAVGITIDIVASEKNGVASALNTGLKICSHEIIARMDADDVSCPGRLLSQIQALHQRPELNVIGTLSLLFRDNAAGNENKRKDLLKLPYSTSNMDTAVEVLRSSLPSSDPGFVAWAILFTCCLSHPTVMFRKSAIDGVRGYDESVSRAEDYDMWHRLLLENPQSIASLPMIGLCHRKHSNSSTSGSNSATQDDEASKISLRAMSALINDKECGLLDIDTVTALKKPDFVSSPAHLDSAAKLLVKLEHGFIDRHSNALTDREIALIRLDCDARISELATLCIQKFGRRVTATSEGAWSIWSNRCPDKNLERIALICHAEK